MFGKQLIGSEPLLPAPHKKTQKTLLKSWEGTLDGRLMAGGGMWGAKERNESKTGGEIKLPGELPKNT